MVHFLQIQTQKNKKCRQGNLGDLIRKSLIGYCAPAVSFPIPIIQAGMHSGYINLLASQSCLNVSLWLLILEGLLIRNLMHIDLESIKLRPPFSGWTTEISLRTSLSFGSQVFPVVPSILCQMKSFVFKVCGRKWLAVPQYTFSFFLDPQLICVAHQSSNQVRPYI